MAVSHAEDMSRVSVTKHQNILSAARQIFLECGYAKASMDAVAARAAVSKATIYAHFTNKRALFEAIVNQRCEAIFSNIPLPEDITDARQALSHLGLRFLSQILQPEALALYRVVLGESPRLPEVGEAFYSAGPAAGQRIVGQFLAEMTRLGCLSIPDAQILPVTDMFLSMLKGDLYTRALLGLKQSPRSIDSVVAAAVDLVLAAFGR